MLDPDNSLKMTTSGEHGLSVSLSLVSMVAHYVSPSVRLDLMSIKIKALRTLTLTCKLWDTKALNSYKPELNKVLSDLGSTLQIE